MNPANNEEPIDEEDALYTNVTTINNDEIMQKLALLAKSD